jgi:hypothetical protein
METPSNATGAQPQHGRRFGRSPLDAVDLEPARRPGVPEERPPRPWPNTRFPPERMRVPPSVPMHGRPNKHMPPVYGTAVPLHGLSGMIRKAAYRYPDHVATHWLLLMFGDRVESWGTRAGRIAKVAAPIAIAAVLAARLLERGPAATR